MTVQVFGAGNHSSLVNQNENIQARRAARQNQGNKQQMQNGSINMNELGGKMDPILSRRQRAQRKALKVIGDAWNVDRKIDNDIGNRRAHIQELHGTVEENMSILEQGDAHKEELRQTYGVSADSQEQKDLELLEKRRRSFKPDSKIELTEEEQERLAELDAGELTEYQQRVLKLDSDMSIFESRIDAAQQEIRSEYSAIREIQIERLKTHEMVDAQIEADEINAAASKEIIGMLVGEAQDHIDEEIEEKKEEAKDKAEEKEEQEEKIEEQRAEEELQQEQLEIRQEESHIEEETKSEQRKRAREQAEFIEEAQGSMVFTGSGTSDAQLAIKEMMQKMKLLEEDLKGAALDAKIETL